MSFFGRQKVKYYDQFQGLFVAECLLVSPKASGCAHVAWSLHIPSSVPFKREKRANLRKHVRRIRSCNSTMRKKVQRYLVIFLVG